MGVFSNAINWTKAAVPRVGVSAAPRPSVTGGASVLPSPVAPITPVTAPDLGPEDFQYFTSGHNRIDQTYGLGAAQNAFQRTQLGLDRASAVGNLARQWDQMRLKLPGAFASRGLLNSGVYAQGLRDYGTNRTLAQGALNRQFDNSAGQLDLSDQQLASIQAAANADLTQQETARRAAIRASLTGY